jgi:hypothetical protein
MRTPFRYYYFGPTDETASAATIQGNRSGQAGQGPNSAINAPLRSLTSPRQD